MEEADTQTKLSLQKSGTREDRWQEVNQQCPLEDLRVTWHLIAFKSYTCTVSPDTNSMNPGVCKPCSRMYLLDTDIQVLEKYF